MTKNILILTALITSFHIFYFNSYFLWHNLTWVRHFANFIPPDSFVLFVSSPVLLFSLILGCGSGSDTAEINASVATQSPPVVTRVNPTSGRADDTITIFGFGFSSQPGINIVSVGATSTTASSYALVDPPAAGEIESLTFTVPSGAAAGANSIFVTVFENTSNTNVQFTVNP